MSSAIFECLLIGRQVEIKFTVKNYSYISNIKFSYVENLIASLLATYFLAFSSF